MTAAKRKPPTRQTAMSRVLARVERCRGCGVWRLMPRKNEKRLRCGSCDAP